MLVCLDYSYDVKIFCQKKKKEKEVNLCVFTEGETELNLTLQKSTATFIYLLGSCIALFAAGGEAMCAAWTDLW